MTDSAIDTNLPPSGDGCIDCTAAGGWWFHLRRCVACGEIHCCDTSPGQHATAHANSSGHDLIASFEPGEDWFYSYTTDEVYDGPTLAPPLHHPLDQPTPGPAGAVPDDWQQHIHQ